MHVERPAACRLCVLLRHAGFQQVRELVVVDAPVLVLVSLHEQQLNLLLFWCEAAGAM